MKNKKELILMIFTVTLLVFSFASCGGSQKISETAEMTELFWSHNGISQNENFSYSLFIESGEPKISARYFDESTGEESYVSALPIDPLEWQSVESLIRKAELPKYKKTLFGTSGCSSDIITVVWNDNGTEKEIKYAGNSSELYDFISETLEYAKTNSERPKNREISDTARLKEFSWSQSGSSSYQCFGFSVRDISSNDAFVEKSEKHFDCNFQSEDGGAVEIVDAVITAEQWSRLEKCLRSFLLSDPKEYSPQSRLILDGDDSNLCITFEDNGEKIKNSYDGRGETEFFELLSELALELEEPSAN